MRRSQRYRDRDRQSPVSQHLPQDQKRLFMPVFGMAIACILLPAPPASGQSVSPQQPDTLPALVLPESSLSEKTTNQVPITLPEVIKLALEGNRDLKIQGLQRIVEQQTRRAAEQAFNPRITPVFSAGLSQNFSSGDINGSDLSLPTGASGRTTNLGSSTALSQTAAVGAQWLTPTGTDLGIQLNPLADTPFSFQITQPLLQGAGRTVTQAALEQARLNEDQGQLALQSQKIETVTAAVTRYTALIQNQEAVRIQEMALGRRRQQLKILQALVKAGRRAPVDLFDTERSITDAERDLIISRNQLNQANTDLLNLIGTDDSIQFVAASGTVQQLFETAIAKVSELELESLVEMAYQLRPDYLQAQLEKDVQALNLLVAEDDLQWQLDIQSNGSLGNFSESTVGVVASRTFPAADLETNRVRSEVNIQQVDNLIFQFQERIRNDVAVRLGDVRSNWARVQAAISSTENARRQLEVDQARFSRGIGGVSIFQVITQEQSLVEAQNAQLQANIAFLNSVAELESTVGIALESWDTIINKNEKKRE